VRSFDIAARRSLYEEPPRVQNPRRQHRGEESIRAKACAPRALLFFCSYDLRPAAIALRTPHYSFGNSGGRP
jgi:hypothetical protein